MLVCVNFLLHLLSCSCSDLLSYGINYVGGVSTNGGHDTMGDENSKLRKKVNKKAEEKYRTLAL